jgi:hypothetical protein
MKRLTFRDAVATVAVAAVFVPYIGYLIRGEMPFIQDPQGMAAIGLLGLLLCFAAWGVGVHSTFGKVMLLLGVAAVGLGIAAGLIGREGSEVLLAVFMGAVAVIYIVEIGYHAVRGDPEHQPA